MTGPTFDSDGYPTDETLERITTWPSADLAGLMRFIADAWHFDSGVTWNLNDAEQKLVGNYLEPDHVRYLRLATGGWSGNESLIAALAKNHIAWLFAWRLSAAGGLHIFRYPKSEGEA